MELTTISGGRKACDHCSFPLDNYDRCFCPATLREVLRGGEFRPADGAKGDRDE
jgi:hypothetical protein